MLLELARRNEFAVLDYCESLLDSGEIENWFTALKALATLGTLQTTDRLFHLYRDANPDKRRYIAQYLAQAVGPVHATLFRRIIRDFAAVGELNINGWTPFAIDTLIDACRLKGISVSHDRPPISRRVRSRSRKISTTPILSGFA
ncbi:MAG: hypothetical protein RTU92_06055 [Candidatus Thorarchaeota archaeon]